MKKTP